MKFKRDDMQNTNKLQKVKEALEYLIIVDDEEISTYDKQKANELGQKALVELEESMEGSVDDKLWQLLDDIDTASDIFKPEQTDFYKYVMAKAQERHRYLVSDGFNLRHRNET